MQRTSEPQGSVRAEDVLYDPRYMWVALDDQKGGAPVLVFRTAEEAADALLGTEGIWLRPVAVFERFKAGLEGTRVKEDVGEYVWAAIGKEPEDALILFETIREAAVFVLDDPHYLLKPMKVM